MKRILLLFFSLLMVVTVGCTKTSESPSPSAIPTLEPVQEVIPSDYFPMTPGSTWGYIGDGNEYASYTQTVLYNECSYFQVSRDNGGTVTSTVYYVSDNDIRMVLSRGEEYDKANIISEPPNTDEIILKTPLEPGTEWESGSIKRRILSMDDTIATPAGLFEDCLTVRSDYPDSYIIDYYVIGIGLVYTEFHSGDDIITSSLEFYDIAD
ncbi:MAG: hypothetical protein JXN10_07455 [Clostridia bacterium]|nr:hypothetical protein [Clostridia bacterium]MBN2883348.1 hypothetical protein [Clostridia bacterium]